MKSRKLMSFLCALCMLLSVMVMPGSAAAAGVSVAKQGEVQEIYIDPVKLDENKYAYYDDYGELIGILTINASAVSTQVASTETFDWTIRAGEYMHDDVSLDTTNGPCTIHYQVYANSGTTVAGYYAEKLSGYRWMNAPFSGNYSGNFMVASSHPINFALKNESRTTIHYSGGYWMTKV